MLNNLLIMHKKTPILICKMTQFQYIIKPQNRKEVKQIYKINSNGKCI